MTSLGALNKALPMPRCVGGGDDLNPRLLSRLNQTFFNNRAPLDYIGMSKKGKVKATIDEMSKPIAKRNYATCASYERREEMQSQAQQWPSLFQIGLPCATAGRVITHTNAQLCVCTLEQERGQGQAHGPARRRIAFDMARGTRMGQRGGA